MVGKKLFLALLLALLPALASAQGPSSAQIEANKGNLKQVNVADLANANKSLMYRVMDGASADDCTVGSGTVQVPCYWDGTTWTAANGSGGSGDVTAVGDCASGACFAGSTGTTLTFNNAGGDGILSYDGTDFAFDKPIDVTGTIGLSSTITFPDNIRQTFNPGADASGLNVGSHAGDPGTPSNGDIWYDSTGNTLDARINGATVSLGAGGGAPTDATYITQTANGSLSAEQALGALSTGCLGSTTTTGVVASRTITGTSNEIAVANGDCSGNPTVSLPATIDLGGKGSFEIPNSAAPTVNAFGEIAGDNDLWAASRGAPVFFDGTASTALVNVLVSDAPANGECPKWNTGGTITWETCAGGVTGTNTQVLFFDGANNPAGDAGFTYNKTTDSATLAGDATLSGGDLTLGAAGTAATVNSLYTGTAGLVLNSATAASGAADVGFNFVVAGNLATADRVLCVGDNTATNCSLMYLDGSGNVNFNGSIDSAGITSTGSIFAGGAAPLGFSGRSEFTSPTNGEVNVENSANSANAGVRFSRIVEVVTTTKSPSATENGEIYTNTGDADGSTITLLDNPTIGSQICVAVNPAQVVTVAPSSGEKILQAGTEYTTSCTNNVRGSTACFVAITGGSGALWSFLSAVGTWTCS